MDISWVNVKAGDSEARASHWLLALSTVNEDEGLEESRAKMRLLPIL